MTILTILGTRPQFIKAAVNNTFAEQTEIQEVLPYTGQNFDSNMSDVFFAGLGIPKPA